MMFQGKSLLGENVLGKGLPAGERQDGGDAGREREGIGESGCLTESILDMELNMFKVGYIPDNGPVPEMDFDCTWDVIKGYGSTRSTPHLSQVPEMDLDCTWAFIEKCGSTRSTAHLSLLGLSRRPTFRKGRSPSLPKVMVIILGTAGFCVADSWADFANNLGSDLAPLIALFGEKVTTQYLSESFSILDNLVFALAPIGIITAIVAAIRVGGNAQFRSFIGRATESRGAVEADLMSSTSSDVYKLWNGEGVVRVLGSPRILQLIYIESEKDGPEAGIYELRDALKQNLYREE